VSWTYGYPPLEKAVLPIDGDESTPIDYSTKKTVLLLAASDTNAKEEEADIISSIDDILIC
jgi:glutaredoxin 2